MEVDEYFGLTRAVVDVAEALSTDWSGFAERLDVVQVVEPDPAAHCELTDRGFVVKPEQLMWVAPTPLDDEDFTRRLPRKVRRSIEAAQETVRSDGITINPEHPLSPEMLDQFLRLYADRVGAMANGHDFASREREDFLADHDYFAVYAHQGTELIGGCLCHCSATDSLTKIRYSAVAGRYRSIGLLRVLCERAFEVARQRGSRLVSLGTDPNLYGHIVKTGLFEFKSTMSFVPVPLQVHMPEYGSDVAELVLSVRKLNDPSLALRYSDLGRLKDSALRGVVYSADAFPDVRPFARSFLDGTETRLVSR